MRIIDLSGNPLGDKGVQMLINTKKMPLLSRIAIGIKDNIQIVLI